MARFTHARRNAARWASRCALLGCAYAVGSVGCSSESDAGHGGSGANGGASSADAGAPGDGGTANAQGEGGNAQADAGNAGSSGEAGSNGADLVSGFWDSARWGQAVWQ